MPIRMPAAALRCATALLLLLPLLPPCAAPAQAQPDGRPALAGSRPNVVFIFSDDHAPHAISAYGSAINETPAIDRLADEGVLFRNCFCGNSICGPSRATVLTGLHTHANGFMRNGNRFDGDQRTFPRMLQAAGYQTAIVGKWHLGTDPTGFDHWIVLPGQGQYYNPDFRTPDGRVRIEGHATEVTTDLAIEWLERGRDADRPFVLMCQHKAPHRTWMPGPDELGMYRDVDIPEPATLFDDYAGRGPAAALQEMEIDRHMYMFYDLKLVPDAGEREDLQGPDRWWAGMLDRMTPAQRSAWNEAYAAENAAFRADAPTGRDLVRWKYQRYIKNHLRCVAGVDRSVGRLLEWLDANPAVAANTIVVYSSDQGFYLGDHGWYDKRWMYEQSLRMPLLVRWPQRIRGGREVSELAQNIDFAPTFLELAGVGVPDDMHGRSLVPLLEGRSPDGWRDAVYYHYYESHAVHNVAAHYGIRTDRYKLMHFYEPEHRCWELYDLQRDPDEMRSVYGDPAYAGVQARLKARLADLRAEYADDTGEIGTFDVTAGVAYAVRTAAGWRIRSNARGTYALNRCDPIHGRATMVCTVRPDDSARAGDGMIVFTAGDARRQLFRAGLDYERGRLAVVGPDLRPLATADIALDSATATELRVDVDLAAHAVTARSGTATVTVDLPPDWDAITAYGYGLSNTTTSFSPISVRR
ncbi:MAG: sulfatase family protein [Planctomycetota bacterium]|jgi:arylsulfatase A-like enzyme